MIHAPLLSTLFATLLAAPIEPGEVAQDFLLRSAAGERIALYGAAELTFATVVAVTTLECPIAKLLLPRLVELEATYLPKGVRFLALDSAPHDTAASVAERAQQVGVRFPILLDPMHAVCDALGVTRTTEVFVLDRDYRLVYRGAVDDQYSEGARRPDPLHHYLVDALEAVLEGNAPELSVTEPAGCKIGPPAHARSDDSITFHRDVAPILNRNCVVCHRTGQIGPMTFLDADTALSYSDMIAEVVDQRRMPPWYADHRYGRFQNERRITETERAILMAWSEADAPEGDPQDAPEPPIFDDTGFAIGEPDLLLELPDVVAIPATGVVDYLYRVIDPGLTEDRWVEAVEIRPTALEVTHHVLALEVPPGLSIKQSMQDRREDGGLVQSGYFAAFVPGSRPNLYPPGTAKRLLAGTRFLLQLHYTPNGLAARDRTQMAIKFAAGSGYSEVKTYGIANYRLDIPPNTLDVMFETTKWFDEPIQLVALLPHLHSRGSSFRYEVVDVEGDVVEVLLSVPHYDFNWQDFYRLREPFLLEQGYGLKITATYDNTEGNPNNPNPAARVRGGDQTFDEMLIGYIDYLELPTEEG